MRTLDMQEIAFWVMVVWFGIMFLGIWLVLKNKDTQGK